jgi:anti-sigma factor RsiW
LLIAVGVGGLSGWQAREMTLVSGNVPAMADAVQAYRMFAVNDNMASDWNTGKPNNVQVWLDKNFAQANRLPDLESAGFKPVSGRLSSTEQGAAAMVVYKDAQGRTLSFYIRPPGDRNHPLPRGTAATASCRPITGRRWLQLCRRRPGRRPGSTSGTPGSLKQPI